MKNLKVLDTGNAQGHEPIISVNYQLVQFTTVFTTKFTKCKKYFCGTERVLLPAPSIWSIVPNKFKKNCNMSKCNK